MDVSSKRDKQGRAAKPEAAETLGGALKAMFDRVAEAPLPRDLLALVDELEEAERSARRPAEPRTLR